MASDSNNSPDKDILTPKGLQALIQIGEKAVDPLLDLGMPFIPVSNSRRFVRSQILLWLSEEASRQAWQRLGSSRTEENDP